MLADVSMVAIIILSDGQIDRREASCVRDRTKMYSRSRANPVYENPAAQTQFSKEYDDNEAYSLLKNPLAYDSGNGFRECAAKSCRRVKTIFELKKIPEAAPEFQMC